MDSEPPIANETCTGRSLSSPSLCISGPLGSEAGLLAKQYGVDG